MSLKTLDLFTGIGGFVLGMERAGHQTVGMVEWDIACQDVLSHHWPDKFLLGDITKVTYKDGKLSGYIGEELKEKMTEIDAICGGYPCTGHSPAGKKKGFEDEGSKLWVEYLRLVKEIKPKYCIIENSHNLRSTGLAELLRAFDEIGYNAEFSVISGYSIGAPHQRERLYIVLWRKDLSYPNPFRYWEPDLKEEKATQGWWAKRRFKRNPVFKQISKIGSTVLQFTDGVSKKSLKREEYKIAMLGNAVIPQIPELIGRALKDHEAECE